MNGSNIEVKTVVTVVQQSEKPVSKVNSQSNEIVKEKSSAENTPTRLNKSETKQPEKAKPKQIISSVRNNQVFLFKVQIAACRVKLSHEDLQIVYQGPEKIMEVFENNWFKYFIGTFTSFDEALNLRDKTNVNGIFIAAYFNGKRVKIPQYLKKLANR